MELTFRTIGGKSFKVEAEPSITVGELKARVEAAQPECPAAQLKLVYKGKVLEPEDKPISELNVDSTGFLVCFVQKAAAPKPADKPAEAKPAAAAPAPAAAAPAAGGAGGSAPAAAAAAPAAAAAAPAEGAAAAAPAAGGDSASSLLSGAALEQAVGNIVEMGFDRNEVMRAMRAAFNNPERAVEYLMNGIPAALAGPPPGAAPAAGGAGGAPAAAAAAGGGGAAAAAGGPPAPQAFNMFGGGGAAGGGGGAGGAAGGGGGGAGPLEFLRHHPQFQMLRRAVQGNPTILVPMLQELGKQNPELLQQINAHQADFLRMVMEPGEGDEDDEMGEGGLPPGVIAVELTPDDEAAIGRLEALGFDRSACIEAYLSCDKQEELAANALLEGTFGD